MSLSLNETHKLVKDAARGTGLTWGEAEELARAAVWLEVAGQGGIGKAADFLADISHRAPCDTALDNEGRWTLSVRTPDEPSISPAAICALTAGIVARDLLAGISNDTSKSVEVRISMTPHPVVTAGVLAEATVPSGRELAIEFLGEETSTKTALTRQASTVTMSGVAATSASSINVIQRPVTQNDSTNHDVIWSKAIYAYALEHGVSPCKAALDELRDRAHNCLVPATEESRLKGAGAGTVDRD